MTHFDTTTDPIRSHDTTDAAPKQKRKRAMTLASGIALVGVAGAGLASTASAATSTSSSSASSVLAKIKSCESGGNYQAVNASSGASGAYQFLNSTWKGLSASAGYTTAASAPASVQDAAALELYNQAGTSPWAASSSCWSSMTSAPTTSTSSSSTS
uniref:transglycosylase family protein n=2 Tax=Dermacoccus TaxID=57495 RepID=UPI0028A1601F